MNYKEAEKLAQRLSLESPDECFYVNLACNDCWHVDHVPQLYGQEFYLNGKLYINTGYTL